MPNIYTMFVCIFIRHDSLICVINHFKFLLTNKIIASFQQTDEIIYASLKIHTPTWARCQRNVRPSYHSEMFSHIFAKVLLYLQQIFLCSVKEVKKNHIASGFTLCPRNKAH